MFARGHPPVYSKEEMAKFDASFQKQLLFNFCATCASCKKSALMLESHASRLREIDLDLTPASFSLETSKCHKLSQYVLEDLLSCPGGSCLIVCIWVGATGNPTKLSYSEQGMHIVKQQKRSSLNSERWCMASDSFNGMQGILIRSMLHHEVVSKSLSYGLFTKYFFNKSGDFGISFDGYTTILSVPWHDVIHCAQVLIFLAKASISHALGDWYSDSSRIPNMLTTYFGSLLWNTLATRECCHSCSPPTRSACAITIDRDASILNVVSLKTRSTHLQL